MTDGQTTGRVRAPDGRWAAHVRVAAAAVLTILLALVLARYLLWAGPVPSSVPARLEDWFDAAAVDADRGFRGGLWALAVVATVVTPAVAVLAALWGAHWRPAVVRLARSRPWRAGIVVGAGLAVATQVALVPVAAARFAWGRHHGVVVQPAGDWLWDRLLALGVQVVLFSVVGWAAAVLLARLARMWWLALAGVIGALTVALVALTPVLVTPLFERTEPLRDAALRAEVLQLAERADVDADDVRVSDAATRTTAANARVAGVGASRRIVLYDTLVRDFPAEQVRVVVAHELAHVRADHIAKGTGWVLLLTLPVCLLLFAVVGWRTGFAPPARDAAGCDLVVRRLAVLAAAAAVLAVVATPLQNAVSSAYEREADAEAIRLTGDPEAAIALQQGLVARARGVPDPPAAVQWWFGSHPTALERIGIALAIDGRNDEGDRWHDDEG